ncbi:MAG: hypothetical protein CML66_22125 [Rhodobacteraceae bacterium]|nr:hypothetical protein [Paracoccaceae bacterium]MAY46724.1 hypothetical protein [Paracoccaceae bacterium]
MAHLLAFTAMFTAVVLTSLGNMAVAIGMGLGSDRRAVHLAYALSLLGIMVTALFVGLGADYVLMSEGWLGWPVLAFGLFDGWRMLRNIGRDETARHVSFASTLVLFTALSIDTLAVLTPLFAEEQSVLRISAFGGGVVAIVLTTLALEWLSERLAPWLEGKRWLDFSGPVAMILAGLYILMDTPTDVI